MATNQNPPKTDPTKTSPQAGQNIVPPPSVAKPPAMPTTGGSVAPLAPAVIASTVPPKQAITQAPAKTPVTQKPTTPKPAAAVAPVKPKEKKVEAPKNTAKVEDPIQEEKENSKAQKLKQMASTIVTENLKEQKENETFIGKLKAKWDEHVDKNKARSETRKASGVKEDDESSNSKKKKGKKGTEDQLPIIIEEGFFENFDPKKDKSKLTPELKQKIKEAEKLYQTGVSTMKDLIAPSSMEIKPNNMKLNGLHVKSFFVFNYPRYLDTNWLSQVINFATTMDISIFVYPEDSGKLMRVLRKKIGEMRSTIRIQERKGTLQDIGVKVALEDAEELRENLQKGVERFFQIGLYFTIYGEDEAKLDGIMKQVQTILGGKLIMTRNADFRAERAFNTTLPQATDEIDVVRNMNSGPAATTFPFVSSDLTSNEGVLFGLNRHNSSLIIFDRFNLANANSVVFASSGGGKSYAVKLEILRSLMLGTDVIILDPENEYQTLCETVGGSYLNISLTSQHRINPFDLPQPFDEKEVVTAELLRENIISLTGLMNLMLGTLNPQEASIMDKALMTTYEIKGITDKTPDPHQYGMPTMLDLQRVLESMQGGQDMASRLERFTTGTFSGLFGTQTNVEIDTSMICFCIRDLEPMLRPIAMYNLLNFIWNRVRSSLKKRVLVVDEAWNIIQHEDSGRFLHGLIKRARKYYLGITTITQDVEDFLSSPWGKPIITNSSMQLLLRQAPSAMEKLQPVFNLTDQEKYLLLNAGVGQGLFFAGNQHVAIEVIASYGEHKIITTNPEEINAMKNSPVENEK